MMTGRSATRLIDGIATAGSGDLAEPLGFDGIWMPEHCGTPYGMTPNPIQALSEIVAALDVATQRVLADIAGKAATLAAANPRK